MQPAKGRKRSLLFFCLRVISLSPNFSCFFLFISVYYIDFFFYSQSLWSGFMCRCPLGPSGTVSLITWVGCCRNASCVGGLSCYNWFFFVVVVPLIGEISPLTGLLTQRLNPNHIFQAVVHMLREREKSKIPKTAKQQQKIKE